MKPEISGVWKRIGLVAGIAMASGVQAQTATFSEIKDSVPGRFFDAATTAPDATNANRLVIGFNTGFDPVTKNSNEFIASTTAFHHDNALDAISFVVTAAPGFFISKITYAQKGTRSISRIAKTAGGASWTVDGIPTQIGLLTTTPNATSTVDLSTLKKTSIPVSITNGLHSFAAPSAGTATIAVKSAEVIVELQSLK
ncbi:MAG: hypothetical protein ACKVQU_14535 [Burkholderiales bacterium]